MERRGDEEGRWIGLTGKSENLFSNQCVSSWQEASSSTCPTASYHRFFAEERIIINIIIINEIQYTCMCVCLQSTESDNFHGLKWSRRRSPPSSFLAYARASITDPFHYYCSGGRACTYVR